MSTELMSVGECDRVRGWEEGHLVGTVRAEGEEEVPFTELIGWVGGQI